MRDCRDDEPGHEGVHQQQNGRMVFNILGLEGYEEDDEATALQAPPSPMHVTVERHDSPMERVKYEEQERFWREYEAKCKRESQESKEASEDEDEDSDEELEMEDVIMT
jgi:hypothetical protein